MTEYEPPTTDTNPSLVQPHRRVLYRVAFGCQDYLARPVLRLARRCGIRSYSFLEELKDDGIPWTLWSGPRLIRQIKAATRISETKTK